MSDRVAAKPPMLRWALRQAGRTEVEATHKWPNFPRWSAGELGPTVRQLKDFATWTHVPPSLLLVGTPPETELPIADFRVGRGQPRLQPSSELLDTIRLCQNRQDWFVDYSEEYGVESFQGTLFSPGMTPSEGGARLRKELAYEVPDRGRLRNSAESRANLIDSFEDLGGLVVVNSVVGNNTHRKLDPEEFRGFTLASPVAPLIFINSADSKNGQIFSLAHKFAHVWRGDTGVSAEDMGGEASNDVESWCNQVAAEFLVPSADLREFGFTEKGFDEALEEATRRYRCSTLVIIIRLRELGVLDRTFLDQVYGRELGRIRAGARAKSSGGDFQATQRYRIGRRFSTHLMADTLSGRTSFTHAMRLTGLNRTTLETLISRQAVA